MEILKVLAWIPFIIILAIVLDKTEKQSKGASDE